MTTTVLAKASGVAPHTRFDTRAELTDARSGGCRRNGLNQSGLSEVLFGIPGIRALHVEPYTLRIYKAECFTWDEIVPRVEEIIKGLEAVK